MNRQTLDTMILDIDNEIAHRLRDGEEMKGRAKKWLSAFIEASSLQVQLDRVRARSLN